LELGIWVFGVKNNSDRDLYCLNSYYGSCSEYPAGIE
jgi:hypothetical protein